MTPQELLQRHQEGLHPCVVAPGQAPSLAATCKACGAPLEAELLSPCSGGRHTSRVILVLRCPGCAATGQLRFTQAAPWNPPPPSPSTQDATVLFPGGGAGYVTCTCSCGGGGCFHYRGHRVRAGVLHVHGVVEGCGHRVTAALPSSPSFRAEPHRHHEPRGA